ncbi:MAG: hypothetical protein HY900_23485 [Deltaproteobacteria bacterium]|nr:hypothetical protein [Deltaproteobacteria bacterium]
MIRRTGLLFVLFAGSAGLLGCGSSDDFESGNRLVISSIEDSAGRAIPVFNALEETDDLGLDHQAGTGDQGEANKFPDAEETVVTPMTEDLGTISLSNQARLGVDPGVDLQVYRVDLSYYDAVGLTHDYAPMKTYSVTGTVPNNGTAEVSLVLVPIEMKTAPNGLRTTFLYGTTAERDAVRTWSVVVDVYANDLVNNRSVHSQGRTSIRFMNPMIEEVADP